MFIETGGLVKEEEHITVAKKVSALKGVVLFYKGRALHTGEDQNPAEGLVARNWIWPVSYFAMVPKSNQSYEST